MLEEGIIERSTSEWSAPVVLVKKEDKSLRICIDYRRLNQVSQFDAYPMPRIEELIDRIGKSDFRTSLIPVEKEGNMRGGFLLENRPE